MTIRSLRVRTEPHLPTSGAEGYHRNFLHLQSIEDSGEGLKIRRVCPKTPVCGPARSRMKSERVQAFAAPSPRRFLGRHFGEIKRERSVSLTGLCSGSWNARSDEKNGHPGLVWISFHLMKTQNEANKARVFNTFLVDAVVRAQEAEDKRLLLRTQGVHTCSTTAFDIRKRRRNDQSVTAIGCTLAMSRHFKSPHRRMVVVKSR